MTIDQPVTEMTPDTFCGESLQPWLEPFWSIAPFEFKGAGVLIVGPHHDVVLTPPLDHTGSFRLHHGVVDI